MKSITRIWKGPLRVVRACSSSALDYLTKLGYSPEISAGMIKACGPAPSTRELHKFGVAGLSHLAKAVQREMDEAAALSGGGRARLRIEVNAPASSRSFTLEAQDGQNLYELAQSGSLGDYLECACKGIAACSTCHVILDPAQAHLFAPPDEAELDMLDLAADVTPTSRLGCQLKLGREHDGLRISIPATFNNLW